MKTFCLFASVFMQILSFAPQQVAATESNRNEWQQKKEFFQKHGYLWIKNFFSTEQTHLLQSWAEDINQASQAMLTLSQNGTPISLTIPGTLIVVPEAKNPRQACRAEDLLTCYPDLYYFIAGTVTNYIGRLLEEPYVLFKDKINFKWPGGGAFLPHQDFPAYEFLGPREHVTAMVCIDEATLENGCLQLAKNWPECFLGDPSLDAEKVQAGRETLPFVVGGTEHGSIQQQYSDKLEWATLEASPGDLIIFNSFIPHYSEKNNSTKPRRAMFLTHNKMKEGDHRRAYYHAKRYDPENPIFHIGTPTKARGK